MKISFGSNYVIKYDTETKADECASNLLNQVNEKQKPYRYDGSPPQYVAYSKNQNVHFITGDDYFVRQSLIDANMNNSNENKIMEEFEKNAKVIDLREKPKIKIEEE